MYDDVLVPTDGSAAAETALEHAIDVAERNDATLHCLHALEIGHVADSLDEETRTRTFDRLRTAGEDAVERIASRAQDAGIDARSTVVEGPATEVILRYATDTDADIVVMATRGRTGEARQVLGSVTERVVRSADVPVLTVNADE